MSLCNDARCMQNKRKGWIVPSQEVKSINMTLYAYAHARLSSDQASVSWPFAVLVLVFLLLFLGLFHIFRLDTRRQSFLLVCTFLGRLGIFELLPGIVDTVLD